MIKSFCVALIVVINAFPYITHAHVYTRSYEERTGEQYPDSTGSYVTNFGNGNNKKNFVKIDETPDRFSVSGASFSNDERGRPSVQKIDVNYNNPSYRGGPQGPDANYNPRATRTQITNIGNGEGNKNLFVFNDNRHDQAYPRNNQESDNGYRGHSYNGYHDGTRYITNIGKGPDNDNRFYVNGKKVYPNAVNNNGVEDTSVIRESLPSANSDGQIRQSQGGVTNVNFKEPNGGTRQYQTRNPEPTHYGYPKTNYPTHNYNQVKITNSVFTDVLNDPSLKDLPMRD